MENVRKYGSTPFRVAVIHGGPGAPGVLAPVARALSEKLGILEPLQTSDSIQGLVQELYEVLVKHSSPPVILIGHSWGAWLSWIFAAYHPQDVRKLILVGSPPFVEKYASGIMATRLERLSSEERAKVQALQAAMADPQHPEKDSCLAQLGGLMAKSDTFDPLPHDGEKIRAQAEIFARVWPEASELRRSGRLLELGRYIKCPTVSIHGDYDSHPYQGVKNPLAQVVEDFRGRLLQHCGHSPWRERLARDEFYQVLQQEIG